MAIEMPNVTVTMSTAPPLAQVAELLGPDMRLRLIKEEPDSLPRVVYQNTYMLLLTIEQYNLLELHSTEPEPAPGYVIGGPLP